MPGVKDGGTGNTEQGTVMRFKFKVREISKDNNNVEDIVDLGEAEIMEAMSFKKLRAKLDHK